MSLSYCCKWLWKLLIISIMFITSCHTYDSQKNIESIVKIEVNLKNSEKNILKKIFVSKKSIDFVETVRSDQALRDYPSGKSRIDPILITFESYGFITQKQLPWIQIFFPKTKQFGWLHQKAIQVISPERFPKKVELNLKDLQRFPKEGCSQKKEGNKKSSCIAIVASKENHKITWLLE